MRSGPHRVGGLGWAEAAAGHPSPGPGRVPSVQVGQDTEAGWEGIHHPGCPRRLVGRSQLKEPPRPSWARHCFLTSSAPTLTPARNPLCPIAPSTDMEGAVLTENPASQGSGLAGHAAAGAARLSAPSLNSRLPGTAGGKEPAGAAVGVVEAELAPRSAPPERGAPPGPQQG